MGVSSGDINCDGKIDFFFSNFGTYATTLVSQGTRSSNLPTIWCFGNDNGTMYCPEMDHYDPNNFSYVSPFGWGTGM